MTVSSLYGFDRFTSTKEPMSLQAAGQQAMSGLGRLARSIFGSVPATNATADELFERATAYEATQPSYAADLRAAAHLAQRRHFGDW